MLLVLNIEGSPVVQLVRLDDSSPGYGDTYAAYVAGFLDPGVVLRYVEVDVSPVSEYGPNDIAAMLRGPKVQDVRGLLTDIPQEWQEVTA